MADLIISQKQKKGKLNFAVPHYILINGKMLGLMKDPSVTVKVPAELRVSVRDGRPEDAQFLAKCIMSGMHFYDFETDVPKGTELFERLTECEQREDLLYTYVHTRVAESDGVPVGSLLSYPGEIYSDLRHKTFAEMWPQFPALDTGSQMETGPGEYYLDTLAVLPEYRGKGIGSVLMKDAIDKGIALGYKQIALVVDAGMPELISLYESLGFEAAEHRQIFGVDFLRMIYTV